jgi:hypothetical protein
VDKYKRKTRGKERIMYGNAMMNGMPMMDSFGWIFMLLFWGLLFVGVIALIRLFSERDGTRRP